MSLWVSRQGLGEWSQARASALADGLGGQSGNTEFRENTSDQRAGARAGRGGAPCGPRPGVRGAGRPRALGVARASRACCLGPRCGASLTCPLTGTERRAREPPPSRLRGKSGRGTHLDPRPELAGPNGRPAPLARGHPRPVVSPHARPGQPVPSDMASSPGGG